MIYGPNGGGKSNVLEAMHTLDAKVLRPLCTTYDKPECEYRVSKISVEPFAFSEETKKEPTEFEVFFRTEPAEYRYILHIKQDIVIFESLDRIKSDTGRRSALFSRKGNDIMLFNNMEINKNGAQLIFTSHDLSTMNNDIFRRDEIWFVAKGREQTEPLYFAYYTANNHRREYVKFLNDRFRELGLGKYQKNREDIFAVLMEKGNPKLAIRHAKRIMEENRGKTPAEIAPGTKVYELVEELGKYLPEEIQIRLWEDECQ